MKMLIACEESGKVRDAFIAKGHNAISCDLLDSRTRGGEMHYKGYLEDIIGDGSEWDMIIAFPPCTYVCSSGLHWNKKRPERAQQTEYALAFICMILNRRTKKIVLENPIGCISTRIAYDDISGYWVMPEANSKAAIKPDQIIQPWQFGHDASKSTCLYLKGVKPLVGTIQIASRIIAGKHRWGNQTDSGQNRLGPSNDRALLRSETYDGIAQAMADQWG